VRRSVLEGRWLARWEAALGGVPQPVDSMTDRVSFRVPRRRSRAVAQPAPCLDERGAVSYPLLLGANLKRRPLFDNSGWEAER
jgi:hypothetical protein